MLLTRFLSTENWHKRDVPFDGTVGKVNKDRRGISGL